MLLQTNRLPEKPLAAASIDPLLRLGKGQHQGQTLQQALMNLDEQAVHPENGHRKSKEADRGRSVLRR